MKNAARGHSADRAIRSPSAALAKRDAISAGDVVGRGIPGPLSTAFILYDLIDDESGAPLGFLIDSSITFINYAQAD